jgi:hypothetical protein
VVTANKHIVANHGLSWSASRARPARRSASRRRSAAAPAAGPDRAGPGGEPDPACAASSTGRPTTCSRR